MSSSLQRLFRDKLSEIERDTKQLNELTKEYHTLRRDAERWRMLQRKALSFPAGGWSILIDSQQGKDIHFELSSAVDALVQAQLDRDGQLPEV